MCPGRYLNLDETLTKMEILCELYPDACDLIELPHTTHEGRTSHAIRVRPGSGRGRQGILLIAGVHAREWGSTDCVIAFLEAILDSYHQGTDLVIGGKTFTSAVVQAAMEAVNLIVFPVVNPDGKLFSMQPGNDEQGFPSYYWRKNRSVTQNPGCRGVDLNRNYDFLWDFRTHFHPDSYGTDWCYYSVSVSDDPCGWTYHGSAVFSEAETQNVRWLLDEHRVVRFFLDLHGVTDPPIVLYSWGSDELQDVDPDMNFTDPTYDGLRGLADVPAAGCTPHVDGPAYKEYMHPVDHARYEAIGAAMATTILAVRGTAYDVAPSYSGLYGTSGSSKDYVFSRHIVGPELGKVDAFLVEWGPTSEWPGYFVFQPPYEDPPGQDKMSPVIQDVSAGLMELCIQANRVPRVRVEPHTLDFAKVRVGTGKVRSVTVKNRGPLTVEVTSIVVEDPAGTGAFTAQVTAPLTVAGETTVSIPVRFGPGIPGAQSADLVLLLRNQGETLEDVRRVELVGNACSVPKNACVAPVFEASSPFACMWMNVSRLMLIILLMMLAWIPGVMCAIRKLQFQMKYCTRGNDDPCIVLGQKDSAD